MITFDKLKLVSSADNINIMHGFVVSTKNNQIIQQKYRITTPCFVEIIVGNDEMSIEFTAKILKNNYPLLINTYTIKTCLEAINQLGVCDLNIDAIMKNSYVVKCDITKDVAGLNLRNVKEHISTHISNHNQWIMRPMKNNDNIILEKNVVTRRNKSRLSIYNKEAEMRKASNKDFLAWAGEDIKNSYTGITRFELSLTTCAAIRSELQIANTELGTVINADANPIVNLLDSALREDTNYMCTITKLSDFDKQTTLAYYNWDIGVIEKNARMIYKERYHKNKLAPYQRLIDAHTKNAMSPPYTYDFHKLCSFYNNEVEYFVEINISNGYWVSRESTTSDTLCQKTMITSDVKCIGAKNVFK